MSRILDFYKISGPSDYKVPAEKQDKLYKKLRFQAFVTATLGYSLYYVCRTSLNVMKQPIIDSGMLDATQLGIIGACQYWAYAAGKFVNGFLADYCNIKKFMATGLVVSAFANFIMGILGIWNGNAGFSSAAIFSRAKRILTCFSAWGRKLSLKLSALEFVNWKYVSRFIPCI